MFKKTMMAGALPPPGVYGMVFGNIYNADRVSAHDNVRKAGLICV